ncbi:MAG: PKD domain-containing protein [Bacteroidia bacterium]|nr:PKD domain-containing protein [Bacteroidia bacterium]
MTPGNYKVTLKLNTDCCGFSDVDTFSVTVRPTPIPAVSIEAVNQVLTACSGDVLRFAATASNAGVSPTYTWSINGANLPNANGPLLIVNNLSNGDTVTCAVLSTLNCAGGQTAYSNPLTVIVYNRPTITAGSISVPAFTTPNTVIPISASASGGVPPYTFFWDFGNGSGGTGSNTSTLFSAPGTYHIKLKIRDANGCESVTDSTTIQVQFSTIASFVPSIVSGCEPLNVAFDNRSLYAISYLWDFGDGSLATTEPSPIHTFRFTSPGVYKVKLISIGGVNQDTVIQQVVVYPKPTADFRVTPSILWHAEDTAFFANTSFGARQWLWNFGDTASINNSSTEPNPFHIYENMGTYTVKLIVTNEFGCSDTITKESIVRQTLDREELLNSNGLIINHVYPNPFSSFFDIRLTAERTTSLKIDLAEMTGKRIATVFSENIQPGSHTVHYTTPENLPDGLYLLLIQTDKQQHSAKLIHIQH